MSDDDIIEECLEGLAEIHKKEFGFIKKEFMSGVVKHWHLDPLTLGAFLMFTPHQVRFVLVYSIYALSNVSLQVKG